jgi:hypothetical protein
MASLWGGVELMRSTAELYLIFHRNSIIREKHNCKDWDRTL